MGVFSVDLNNINLVDVNFDEDVHETIIMSKFILQVARIGACQKMRKKEQNRFSLMESIIKLLVLFQPK